MVVHQYDLFEQVGWSSVDDAANGSLNDRQSLIQINQHHAEGGQIVGVFTANASTEIDECIKTDVEFQSVFINC